MFDDWLPITPPQIPCSRWLQRKLQVCYRPQRSWGKVIFSEACVNNSVHGGGRAWLPGGACMVLFGGACVVLFSGGACVVLFSGGCAWFYSVGGHAWFYSGGHAWFFQFFRIQWDTVNERAVRILLECILVFLSIQEANNDKTPI